MQIKKDEVKDRLMSAALCEFLAHGYTETSLRVVADKANLTKGAVYAYFNSKDELFNELASPAVRFIESEFNDCPNCDASEYRDIIFSSLETTVESFRRYVQAVLTNHDSFKLLLFCAAGSSLQNYKESIVLMYAQSFCKFLSYLSEVDGRKPVIGEMFVHTLANTFVSFLEELVIHEPSPEEADAYATQMAVFIRSGYEELYNHQLR